MKSSVRENPGSGDLCMDREREIGPSSSKRVTVVNGLPCGTELLDIVDSVLEQMDRGDTGLSGLVV